jgi:S-adenosylmethionine hydrolase
MCNVIITLTTDFGLKDPYVAEMKAVILSILPNATIVDVSHAVEKFDVRMGAYVLASAASFFPKGTIHVAVVDPGVGTKRRGLLMQTKRGFFVGPDNGVLVLAARNQGLEHVYEITNRKFMLREVSSTFHGRDVFAPVAAHLADGKLPAEFGPETQEFVTPKFVSVTRRGKVFLGEVLHVDDFGNIITSFTDAQLKSLRAKDEITLKLGRTMLRLKLLKAYAEVEKHKPLAVIGSHRFLEVSINQGNAAKHFKTETGDKAKLHISEQ